MKMANPHTKFILLCALCNQRMRFVANEFLEADLPNKVATLYESGWTIEELAEKYDCVDKTISRFLKKKGVVVRAGSYEGGRLAWLRPESRMKLIAERRSRFLNKKRIKLAKQVTAMYDMGDSLREVAQWFGMSKNSVRCLLGMIL
jgi:hypothetical protein